jgi:hypothetical protein
MAMLFTVMNAGLILCSLFSFIFNCFLFKYYRLIMFSLNKHYGTQLFKIIANNYLASSLALFSNIVEIYLSIQRFFILTNKNSLQNISYKLVISIIFFISALYYLNVLFCYDIIGYEFTFGNKIIITTYSTALSDYSRSLAGKAITFSFVLFRIFLSTFVLPAINIINLILFRKVFRRKLEIKSKFQCNESSNIISWF